MKRSTENSTGEGNMEVNFTFLHLWILCTYSRWADLYSIDPCAQSSITAQTRMKIKSAFPWIQLKAQNNSTPPELLKENILHTIMRRPCQTVRFLFKHFPREVTSNGTCFTIFIFLERLAKLDTNASDMYLNNWKTGKSLSDQ